MSVKPEGLLGDIKTANVFHHPVKAKTWGTLVVLALLQVLANKLYKTYREKIFNTS